MGCGSPQLCHHLSPLGRVPPRETSCPLHAVLKDSGQAPSAIPGAARNTDAAAGLPSHAPPCSGWEPADLCDSKHCACCSPSTGHQSQGILGASCWGQLTVLRTALSWFSLPTLASLRLRVSQPSTCMASLCPSPTPPTSGSPSASDPFDSPGCGDMGSGCCRRRCQRRSPPSPQLRFSVQ